jgi:hypothetical protein
MLGNVAQKNRSLEEDALYDLLIVLVEKFEREFYEQQFQIQTLQLGSLAVETAAT